MTAPLIRSLKDDPHSDVRYHAAQALGKQRSDDSSDALMESLTGGDDAFVRSAAAEALGDLASSTAV